MAFLQVNLTPRSIIRRVRVIKTIHNKKAISTYFQVLETGGTSTLRTTPDYLVVWDSEITIKTGAIPIKRITKIGGMREETLRLPQSWILKQVSTGKVAREKECIF